MGNIFRGDEIVELGVRIEENGRDFYRALAEKSGDSQTKELFTYLAGEEEKHRAIFQEMLSRLERREPQESYPGEYNAYMTALADESIFAKKDKGEELARSMKSEMHAIEFGIGVEKDSIVFYLGMKGVVPEGDHPVLDSLIGEEQKHLRQLIELKKRRSS